MDIRLGHTRTAGGVSARLQDTPANGGYAAWINLDDGGKKLTLYRLTSTDGGTSLTNLSLMSGSKTMLTTGVWFKISLSVLNESGGVRLVAGVTSNGIPVGGTLPYFDTAANRVTTAGRFGIRCELPKVDGISTAIDFDNVIARSQAVGTLVAVR